MAANVKSRVSQEDTTKFSTCRQRQIAHPANRHKGSHD
jgi:hypothetical protein